ncbi:cytochrome P450 [Streptomyces sp. YIM 98790]|uniref:cytochrome P450 n=1 Tax=Streptomyces sp. YIM 98790 TaxID=2689077 RepID=UPI001FB70F9A|nr:cytochrome P450 [Streptomyces sp. YIM 98790]
MSAISVRASLLRSPAAAYGWPEADRIPHPRHRIPLVGDVIGARPRTPVQESMRLARELGPVFRRRFFGMEVVMVSGPELVGDLADESRFTKRVMLAVRSLRQVAGDGLFTAHSDEPNWRLAHEILAPGFTREAMERYHPTMLDVTGQLLRIWDRHAAAGKPVDVTRDMTRLTLETIGRTGFGYRFDSFERREPHPFVTAMVGALEHAQRRAVTAPVAGPLIARIAGARNAADVRLLNETVDAVIRERTARGRGRGPGAAGGAGPADLLGLMLGSTHPETGERLAPANIRNQVITFLVAGHETTSGALSFALYFLARHPAVLARAQDEVDRVWGTGPAEPRYEQVPRLRYVRRVLDESLRLWPTAPGFIRAAREDTLLAGTHPMRKGAWAVVLVPALHRDPSVWGPDPESFDPDRFLPERVRARPSHVFKPFGTGERACIGRQFALHEATLVLGMLLRRYDLHADPAYRLKVVERLTLMPADLRLTLTPRRTVSTVSYAPGR